MKKNLLILGMLLAVVAVATRLHRDPNLIPGGEALCQDEKRCLEALWGQTTRAKLEHDRTGLVLEIVQSFPADASPARRSWSHKLAYLVSQRHPQVDVSQIVILDGATIREIPPAPDSLTPSERDRSELLCRQRQAVADQITPGTLVLLDVIWAAPPARKVELENRVESSGARRRAPQGDASGASIRDMEESASPQTQTSPVSTTCWLVTTSEPSQALLDALQPVERVVRLPNP